MKKNRITSALTEKIITIVFLLSFCCILAYPVADPDVFWHIKTGEWIWQHKALPDKDPFSYTIDDSVYASHIRPSVILKQYWLSQLLLYGLHSSLGWYGIILFRYAIYLALLALLYAWMRKKNVNNLSALFFLLPVFLLVLAYGGERPNTLSYLFAALLFYLTDEFILTGDNRGFFLPAVMLIWSLMHGGFLLGEVVLAVYFIVTLFRGIKEQAIDRSYLFKLSVLALSMAAPFLFSSVARQTALMMVHEASGPLAVLYKNSVAETISPFTNPETNIDLFAYLAFIILLLIVVIKHLPLEHTLLAAFLLALSCSSIRFFAFFLIIASPMAAFHWSARPSFDLTNKVFRNSIYATILFCTIFMGQAGARRSFFLDGLVSKYYPGDAVTFLKTAKPEGNMFNSYTWGGYLINELYPDRKVFIDPRALSLPLYAQYHNIFAVMAKKTEHAWRDVFEEYHISVVLIPPYSVIDGKFTLLIKKLVDDPEWSLVFAGEQSAALIFLKNDSANDQLIRHYSLKKEAAFERALKELAKDAEKNSSWRTDLQIAVVSLFMKRYEEAEYYLTRARDRNNKLSGTSVDKVLGMLKKDDYAHLDTEEIYNIYGM